MNCCHIGWRRRFVIKFETPSAVHPSLLHVSLVTYFFPHPKLGQQTAVCGGGGGKGGITLLVVWCHYNLAWGMCLAGCQTKGWSKFERDLMVPLFLSHGQPLQIRYHLTWPSCVSVCIVSRRIWLRSVPFQPCWVLLCVIIQPSIHTFFLAGPKQ